MLSEANGMNVKADKPEALKINLLIDRDTVGKKSIRALEIFRVQKLILNATS